MENMEAGIKLLKLIGKKDESVFWRFKILRMDLHLVRDIKTTEPDL